MSGPVSFDPGCADVRDRRAGGGLEMGGGPAIRGTEIGPGVAPGPFHAADQRTKTYANALVCRSPSSALHVASLPAELVQSWPQ